MSASPEAKRPESQTIILSSGRTLGYATYGDPSGPALFWFHGLPSSRPEAAEADFIATKLGVRFISVDRPGMGLSIFQPNRTLLDWPGDVEQLAQCLNVSQYRVVGLSGGYPYALACAKALPKKKLLGVSIVAGPAPWSMGLQGVAVTRRVVLNVMALSQWMTRWVLGWIQGYIAQFSDREILKLTFDKAARGMKYRDRAVFEDERLQDIRFTVLRESYRQGSEGNVEEVWLVTSPWGFELEDVAFEGVRLWYGTEDENTPVGMGRKMAERLPHVVMKEYVGDSHMSILHNHLEDIKRDLMDMQDA